MVELRKLFGNIFLGKFPIAHKPLHRAELQDTGKNAFRTGEILGRTVRQVNEEGEEPRIQECLVKRESAMAGCISAGPSPSFSIAQFSSLAGLAA
jgi:hypothetical protein